MKLSEQLAHLASHPEFPDRDAYIRLLERTIVALEHENPAIRPPDSAGLSGALVYLHKDIPTLILPDLHGRFGFFLKAMEYCPMGGSAVFDQLEGGTIQVLCLGDGFHSEKRGMKRWALAFEEFSNGYKKHKAMDAEMTENLVLMEMVMECKRAHRDHFHFLKGNHENILNEEGNGNHAFRKFAFEGEMVKEYVLKVYGKEFIETFALFEKRLPLFAEGKNFLASHAEPKRFLSREEIREGRNDTDTVLSLTWTNNGDAEEDSVKSMLNAYLEKPEEGIYFGGHRPVTGRYQYRAENAYLQFHNPEMNNAALIFPDRPFNPETDIITIE